MIHTHFCLKSQAFVHAQTFHMNNLRCTHTSFTHTHTSLFAVPKSQAFVYAQMPFYLNNLGETREITATIEQIRDICDAFQERGLPNYPTGIPFTFWEQYLNLRFYLMLSLICVLGAIFIVLTLVLVNPWIAIIVVSSAYFSGVDGGKRKPQASPERRDLSQTRWKCRNSFHSQLSPEGEFVFTSFSRPCVQGFPQHINLDARI